MLESILTFHCLVAAGAGYVLGAFTPAVGRKIKAFFVAEDTKLEARVKALEAKIVADGEAALKKA